MCEWLFPLTYVGLTAFLYILFDGEKINRPFKRAFAFFMGALPIVYSWFAELYPFDGFGFTPFQGVIIVILGIFGISAYHSVVISLIFLLSKLIPQNKPMLMPPCVAGLFVIYEWFLNIGPLKFSWATVAISQIKFAPLLQTASLFGCYFITFTVVTFCGYMALFAHGMNIKAAKLAAASLIIPVAAGTVLLCIPINKGIEINTAAVQGNALSNEKWDKDRLDDIINTYVTLAEEAAKNGAELVVLPESAFPTYYVLGGPIHTALSDIAKEYDCTVISGVLLNDNGKHNAMFVNKSDGTFTNYYTKRNLVPFGETIPFEKLVGKILDALDIKLSSNPYVVGTSPEIINVGDISYGGIICYDSIFPWTVRESVNAGANLLIIVTNDSWYKDAPAVKQHVWHAALRAVENGRYIVRAANTGISCFITPKGEIIGATPPLVEAVTYSNVYTTETRTLYTLVGDVPLYISIAAYCIMIIIKITEGIKNHDKHKTV